MADEKGIIGGIIGAVVIGGAIVGGVMLNDDDGTPVADDTKPPVVGIIGTVSPIDPEKEPAISGAKKVVLSDAVFERARKDTIRMPITDPKKPDSIIRWDTNIVDVPERVRRDPIRIGVNDTRDLVPGDTLTLALYYGKTAKGVDSVWLRVKTYIDPAVYPAKGALRPMVKTMLIEVPNEK